MKHLFLLTIPTVQAFIKQARKTQDLFVGSRLLSDLIKCGANEFNKSGKLIFPVSGAETFTNRFLGEIDGEKSESELQKIGNDTKDAIQKHLIKIAHESVEYVIGQGNLPVGFNEQIEQLLDIKWAVVKWNGNHETYKTTYSELEKLIGAIKNVRIFKQYNYQTINGKTIFGEQGRKCSVDGERNVKFYRKTENDIEKETKSANHTLKRKLFIDNEKEVCFVNKNVAIKHLNYGEGLSAVSFFKRCYAPQNCKTEFPSTAEIALLQTINSIVKLEGTELANKYLNFRIELQRIGDNDAQLCYEENYTKNYFVRNNIDIKLLNPLKDKLKEIVKLARQAGIDFNSYYAIIIFDGDSMGEWLSGENLQTGSNLYEFHKKLSECLGIFSVDVEKILIAPKGKTVYSGGDDFVGFVNLEHLFPVMQEINELFDKEVNSKLIGNKNFTIKDSKKLSISAGIAIAHYKTPLSIVLEKAREIETVAKQNEINNEKKNSFAIAVLKRSGEINQTVWKWKHDRITLTTQILQNLISALQGEKGISNKFIKNAQIEFSLLCDDKGLLNVASKIFNTEFERLLKKSGDTDNSTFKMLKSVLPQENDKNYNLQNFFMALNIADFIQRNTNGIKEQENGE